MRTSIQLLAVIALLPALTMCKRSAPQVEAQELKPSTPIEAEAVVSSAPLSAQQTLDENDRIIAENQRMIGVLAGYSHTDADKLGRLTAACQKKLGDNLNGPGARRIFGCIQSSW